jgi:ABC-type transporter Mla subunit MlaD
MANVNQPQKLGEQVGQTASNVADKAKETAGNVLDMGKEMAQTAANRIGDTARTVGEKAEQATNRLGERIKSAGHNLREKAPQRGLLHSASESLADSLETSGEYLQEKGISGMAGDVTELIRRNPIPALLVAVGIGFLIARSFRS